MSIKYTGGVLAAVLFLIPTASFAYIGPGAGISAIGTLIAVVGAILLAIVGFVWYPVKRMLKRRAAAQTPDAKAPE